MRGKDRNQLHALAYLLGVADARGEPLPRDVVDKHDWRRFLLAKDMEPGPYSGPSWAPFALWSAYEWSGGTLHVVVDKLLHAAGAREVWAAIESNYEHPNNVAQTMPAELARVIDMWRATSKRGPREHREHQLAMKGKALALAREIERTRELDALSTGEPFDFMRLYTDEERASIYRSVRLHNLRLRNTVLMEVQAREFGYKPGDVAGVVTEEDWDRYNAPENADEPESPVNHSLAGREASETWDLLTGGIDQEWPGIVPDVPTLLRKLADYFDAQASSPAMQRPAYENAERNFVTRHLCLYFRTS